MFKQRVVFVHGAGSFGAAAWPKQHGMALAYDALFLRRHGFDPAAEPLETDFAADTAIVLASLADDGRGEAGGHVVAHSQGAIAAMMAAVQRPDLVQSLTLVEPACLSLTAELPATAAHRALMQPLFDVRHQLSDEDFQREYVRRAFSADVHGASHPGGPPCRPAAEAAGTAVGGAAADRPRGAHPRTHRRLGAAVRRDRRLSARNRRAAPGRRGRTPAPGFGGRQPDDPVLHRRGQPARGTPGPADPGVPGFPRWSRRLRLCGAVAARRGGPPTVRAGRPFRRRRGTPGSSPASRPPCPPVRPASPRSRTRPGCPG